MIRSSCPFSAVIIARGAPTQRDHPRCLMERGTTGEFAMLA
jgi:hypothetical protein